MPSQRVPRRKLGMIEVLDGIVRHTELLHNPARTNVRRNRDTDNFRQPKRVPGMPQDGSSGLRCQALAPRMPCQSPSDFHAWSEVRVKGWHTQSNEASKSPIRSEFRRIQSETMLSKMTFDLCSQRIALRGGERRREELHDPGIGIHPRERLAIRVSPVAKNHARSLDARGLRHLSPSAPCGLLV